MDSRFLEALAALETRHKRFSLVGTSNVQASGSLKTGFAVNVVRPSRETPEPATGACCAEDGSCSVTTFGDCVGTWRGPDTGCDPNPCGCCDCALPESDCPQAICCRFTLDGDDTADTYIVALIDNNETVALGLWLNSDRDTWFVDIGCERISFPATDPLGVEHCFNLSYTRDGARTSTVTATIDGSGDSASAILAGFSTVRAGSWSGSGNAHRTINCVEVRPALAACNNNFDFPSDSFESFVGGASIVDGALRVDSEDEDAYADASIDTGVTATITLSGEFAPCCAENQSHSGSVIYQAYINTSDPVAINALGGCAFSQLYSPSNPPDIVSVYYAGCDDTECQWFDAGHTIPCLPVFGPLPSMVVSVARICDTWYVLIWNHFTAEPCGVVLFYGSTTDISSPIENTVTCDSECGFTIDDEFSDYWFCGPANLTPLGTGGTATIAIS